MKKKLLSLLLAIAMLLTMVSIPAFAKVSTSGYGEFKYALIDIFNEDFNDYNVGDTTSGVTGFDLDVKDGDTIVKPTKWEYVERAEDDTAMKVYIDKDVTYTTNKPYVAISADTDKMASVEGEKGFVNEFDVMFPEIPTAASKTITFATKVRGVNASGSESTQVLQYASASTPATLTDDESSNFSFRSGGEYLNIEAERWYKVTLAIDIENQKYLLLIV